MISRHQNVKLSYEALDRDSNALAKGLENQGVKKGDRVAVSLGNNIEFATVRDAALSLGRGLRLLTGQRQTTYALFKLGAILVRGSLAKLAPSCHQRRRILT